MKTATDIEQSKKLAKILPIESADMYYDVDSYGVRTTPEVLIASVVRKKDIPCWSLSALMNVIPYTIYKSDTEFYRLGIDKGYNGYAVWYNNYGFTVNDLDVTSDNFVDACYEMILKLKEKNLI